MPPGGLALPLPRASVNQISGLLQTLSAPPYTGHAELSALARTLVLEARKRLLREHLLRFVPLASHIHRVLEEREEHWALHLDLEIGLRSSNAAPAAMPRPPQCGRLSGCRFLGNSAREQVFLCANPAGSLGSATPPWDSRLEKLHGCRDCPTIYCVTERAPGSCLDRRPGAVARRGAHRRIGLLLCEINTLMGLRQ